MLAEVALHGNSIGERGRTALDAAAARLPGMRVRYEREAIHTLAFAPVPAAEAPPPVEEAHVPQLAEQVEVQPAPPVDALG